MTKKTHLTNSYDTFLDVYLQELIEAPDSEILDGIDSDAEKALGLKLLEQASDAAGRKKLSRARAAISNRPPQASTVDLGISASDARRFVLIAMNDPRMTLAARKLDELSDEDILLMYSQIKELQDHDEDGAPAK